MFTDFDDMLGIVPSTDDYIFMVIIMTSWIPDHVEIFYCLLAELLKKLWTDLNKVFTQ